MIFLSVLPTTLVLAADNVYQVSLLRASPGDMPALIELAKASKAELKGEMLIMRRSQGDHWDLMLLSPAGEAWFSLRATLELAELLPYRQL
ncbi:MAG: hypothetical protein ACI9WC_000384 [Arenicella sp.]